MSLTRRHFLERLAAVGGASLTYEAMIGLGLLAAPRQTRFELQGHVSGVRILVLGAGLAGLTVAYELGKLGYRCQVLEARPRPGGRVLTVRRGTVSEEEGPSQVAAFDEGLYYNPGPMRIPHHHDTTMAYCRELQVPIEPFCIQCDTAFVYQQYSDQLAGRRIRLREARTDLDGYVAELLSKALSEESLNQPMSKDDRENLLEYLREAGALDEKRQYRESSRRGYQVDPRAGETVAKPSTPLDLSELLESRTGFYVQREFDYQNTMFQVVGGMDRLSSALASRLKDKIRFRVAVREIRQSEHGVSVVYADHDGRVRQVQADYCVCTLPLTVLATLQCDFAPEFRKAIASIPYAAAGKIGLQFKRRFWEEDDSIYGGISRTDQHIGQIVYPSHGFNGRKGVLIGYYIMGEDGRPVGEMRPAQRQELALTQGSRIHPQYRAEFETAFSVAWHRVPWSRGSWATFSMEARRDIHPLLKQPDGRVYLAGDHISNINAWMQGAFESARQVAMAVHARAPEIRPRVSADKGE